MKENRSLLGKEWGMNKGAFILGRRTCTKSMGHTTPNIGDGPVSNSRYLRHRERVGSVAGKVNRGEITKSFVCCAKGLDFIQWAIGSH